MREILKLGKVLNKINKEKDNLYVSEIGLDANSNLLSRVKFTLLHSGNQGEFYNKIFVDIEKAQKKESYKITTPYMVAYINTSLNTYNKYYDVLKHEIDEVLSYFSVVERVLSHADLKLPDLFNNIEKEANFKCPEIKKPKNSINNNDICSWKHISSPIAMYIANVLNDAYLSDIHKYSYNLNTERFTLSNNSNIVSDKTIIKLLEDESSLLKTISSNNGANTMDIDSYKAINKEAIDLMLHNEMYLLNQKDISGISAYQLREVGLSFKDINYLKSLNLKDLNNISYEQAKQMSSIFYFSFNSQGDSVSDFTQLFKDYQAKIEKNEELYDSAVITLCFGSIDLELNIYREENKNLSLCYFACIKKYMPDNKSPEWESYKYTDISESLYELSKVESIENFEKKLFNSLIEFSKKENIKWYSLM